MTTEEIVEKITSHDTHFVWLSACYIIELSQDRAAIAPLIPHLAEIQQQTEGLQMGGMLAPNQRFIDFAIRIIQYHKARVACTCHLYPHYESFNPSKEQKKGNIAILDTVMEQQWVDYYTAKCRACQQAFKITEREGHFLWWKWTEIKADPETRL